MNKFDNIRVAIYLFLILTLCLSGCQGDQTNTAIPATATAAPTEIVEDLHNALTELPSETPENNQAGEENENSRERTNYSFEATLDYNKHTLLVAESIQYKNTIGNEIQQIQLAVPPNRKNGVFQLDSIIINDVISTEYMLDGVILKLDLNEPIEIGESINIEIVYLLKPKISGGFLGYSAKCINFSDWYPFIPPYDDEKGWVIHQPAEVGEYLVYDMADFDLTLDLAGQDGLVIAASTQVVPVAIGQYQLQSKKARNLTFSVSDRFTVLTKEIDGVTVNGYVYEGDEASGWAAVNNSANALMLYGELLGMPYPHETFTVVESDFQDGMEYDGFYYLSDFYFKNYDGTFQNYLSLLSVHETSHQWWFGLVGNDQALEPWLDESLATYSEYLYIERYYPELKDWWWQYRVETYHPSGRMNLTIYETSDLRTYINAVYLQGARFLHELRQVLGDENFFFGLRTYAAGRDQKIATWNDFLNNVVPNSAESTDSLLQKYFK